MVRIVNVHEAKTTLSRLLVEVEHGDEVLIARNGQPIAKLSAVQRTRREIGFADGQTWIADDFDEAFDR